MKTKPILIISAVVLVVAAGCFAFFKYRSQNKPGKSEIIQFLNAFNKHIQAGNIDSAKTFFEDQQKSKAVKVLLSVLTNKTNTGGKEKPLFKTSMNTEDAVVNIINQEFATALVVTRFNHDDVSEDRSTILFTIHKLQEGQYKITQVDAKAFVKDYVAFQNKIFIKITPEKDIYNAITLAAFKAADQLKARYDSVAWFDHIDNRTFYYVVKGKLPDDFIFQQGAVNGKQYSGYKMGLVNPELKEIIPPDYDLVHNISGTIGNLIEVEKGDKKGFYNLYGKIVVPVDYDQIYPLKTGEDLAVLKNGNDFFYLKSDSTISDKITDFKIADVVSQISAFGNSFKLSDKSSKNVMEYNSRTLNTSLIVPPSYMVELQLLPQFVNFPNPLRKIMNDDDSYSGSGSIAVTFDGEKDSDDGSNWFKSAFYTIANDYLGGRGGLYQSKNVLVVDKKHNQILGFNADLSLGEEEDFGNLTGDCHENSIKALNDSLFEFKTTSDIGVVLYGQAEDIDEGPLYHYLQVKDGKFVALESGRVFPTQYIKLDDSYLQACYTLGIGTYPNRKTKTVDHLTKEMLQYMKNEIYASYKYRFKSKEWSDVFDYRFNSSDTTKNANVDDSLTTIDKYNIAFINSKLNGKPLNVKMPNSLAAR